MPLTIGVDVGGTFTDVVTHDGTSVTGRKLPTTPEQSAGVLDALRGAGAGESTVFLHGTTAGTNALLEGRGGRVALVTSPGFRDVVEIGRQARPSLYDSFADRPEPLVPRDRRVEYDGDLGSLLETLRGLDPETVAVALVRSFQDPTGEIRLAESVARELGVPVSTGARVSPAFREYERVATTVLDAYLTPEVSGYLQRLDDVAGVGRRLVMTSSGGLLPFESAVARAGRLVLSGPAAGVVAAAELGRVKGHDSVISFDMGGTSTDVCRIARDLSRGRGGRAGAERVNRVPSLPVRTIGAGGGSMAWLDEGGAMRVGPRSAGSVPGPAAYGQGGDRATVTDANVVLGRIPAHLAMGGTVVLDTAKALQAVASVGALLGMSPQASASGIIEVVDAHMERALRAVSVEEGADPRESALIAFGGAGGLHATRMARRLDMPKVLVPPLSGVFSALGLLLARPGSDATRTVMLEEGSGSLETAFSGIRAEARDVFVSDHGVTADGEEAYGEVRYRGQSHELTVLLSPRWDQLRERFEAEHVSRFGFSRPGQPIELVDVRAEVTGRAPLVWSDLPTLPDMAPPEPSRVEATVGGVTSHVPLWWRAELPAGFGAVGPGVVVEDDSAVWLEPGDRLTTHEDGTLEITW